MKCLPPWVADIRRPLRSERSEQPSAGAPGGPPEAMPPSLTRQGMQ